MSISPSEPDSLLIRALEGSLRAELTAKGAHERLDRMNGSIDNLAKEVKAVGEGVTRIDNALAIDAGVSLGRKQILTPTRMVGIALISPMLSAIFVKVLT
jgi:hypothetical protein